MGEEVRTELRRMGIWREGCSRGSHRYLEGLRQVEHHISEVAATRTLDVRVAEEEERELSRQHIEVVAKLRRRLADEATLCEKMMDRSICNLSEDLATDGDAVLCVHAELEASAECLAARARAYLGS